MIIILTLHSHHPSRFKDQCDDKVIHIDYYTLGKGMSPSMSHSLCIMLVLTLHQSLLLAVSSTWRMASSISRSVPSIPFIPSICFSFYIPPAFLVFKYGSHPETTHHTIPCRPTQRQLNRTSIQVVKILNAEVNIGAVECEILNNSKLGSQKGVNLPGTPLHPTTLSLSLTPALPCHHSII